MSKLSEVIDFVVGVDTHKTSHSGAVLDTTGAVHATTTLPADAFGYRRLVTFARAHATNRRLWAIEGTGSFGRGLTTFLLEQREWVVEIDRPARPARRAVQSGLLHCPIWSGIRCPVCLRQWLDNDGIA